MAEEASWNVFLESQIREDGFKGALILIIILIIIIIILRDYNTFWVRFLFFCLDGGFSSRRDGRHGRRGFVERLSGVSD